MKFTAQVGDLLSGVDIANKVVSTRGQVQVLSGVRLTGSGKWLEVAATDMENSLVTQVPVAKSTSGVCVVNAKTLLATLKSLPKGDVITFDHDTKKNVVTLESGTAKMTLEAYVAEDFPNLPEPPTGQFPVRTAAFQKAFDVVKRSASKDQSRPVLTTVLLTVQEGVMGMAATDSYRLAMTREEIDSNGAVFDEKIPAKGLMILSRLIAKYDSFLMGGSMTMGKNAGNLVGFTFGTTQLLCRRVDGQFPDVTRLLPDAFEGYLTFDRKRVLPVVQRLAKIGAKNLPFRIAVNPDGNVTVSLVQQDLGEVSDTIEATVTGLKEPMVCGFNAEFFAEGLESLPDDVVTVALINPLRPALLYGGEPLHGSKPDTAYLIMPIRLAG